MILVTLSLMNTPFLAKLLLFGLTSVASKQLVVMTKHLEESFVLTPVADKLLYHANNRQICW